MSAFTKFYFRPGEHELIETVVRLQPDTRSSIHGYVREPDGRAIADALIMLFEVAEEEELTLYTQTFTDEHGQFILGPLSAGQLYMIKAFKNSVKIRELQIQAE